MCVCVYVCVYIYIYRERERERERGERERERDRGLSYVHALQRKSKSGTTLPAFAAGVTLPRKDMKITGRGHVPKPSPRPNYECVG